MGAAVATFYLVKLFLERTPLERDAAAVKLGKTCEITRFKGLGEINPSEFKQFIGEEMRLSKVEYAPKPEAAGILTFYMGKNTPERKDYIMENLVVPVED